MKNLHDFINISFSSLTAISANSVFLPAKVLKEIFGPVSNFAEHLTSMGTNLGHEVVIEQKKREKKKRKKKHCKSAEQSPPARFSNREVQIITLPELGRAFCLR